MRLEALKDILRNLGNAIRLAFTRGTVTLVYTNAAGQMQKVQITGLAAELSDTIEHAQPYGLHAHPLAGAEAFVSAVLGQRSHLIATVIGDARYSPDSLKPGEVVVYSKHGQTIHLKDTGEIHIDAPAPITASAPEVNVITKAAKVDADTVTVDATTVDVKATEVGISAQTSRIAGGGIILGDGADAKPIARVGDMVNVGSGSSAGRWPIVSGSDFASAS